MKEKDSTGIDISTIDVSGWENNDTVQSGSNDTSLLRLALEGKDALEEYEDASN